MVGCGAASRPPCVSLHDEVSDATPAAVQATLFEIVGERAQTATLTQQLVAQIEEREARLRSLLG